jgi:hypothetical protein
VPTIIKMFQVQLLVTCGPHHFKKVPNALSQGLDPGEMVAIFRFD